MWHSLARGMYHGSQTGQSECWVACSTLTKGNDHSGKRPHMVSSSQAEVHAACIALRCHMSVGPRCHVCCSVAPAPDSLVSTTHTPGWITLHAAPVPAALGSALCAHLCRAVLEHLGWVLHMVWTMSPACRAGSVCAVPWVGLFRISGYTRGQMVGLCRPDPACGQYVWHPWSRLCSKCFSAACTSVSMRTLPRCCLGAVFLWPALFLMSERGMVMSCCQSNTSQKGRRIIYENSKCWGGETPNQWRNQEMLS